MRADFVVGRRSGQPFAEAVGCDRGGRARDGGNGRERAACNPPTAASYDQQDRRDRNERRAEQILHALLGGLERGRQQQRAVAALERTDAQVRAGDRGVEKSLLWRPTRRGPLRHRDRERRRLRLHERAVTGAHQRKAVQRRLGPVATWRGQFGEHVAVHFAAGAED